MKLVFNPFTGNLDYVASSPGDVGIVFPLVPNLGGTGIANAVGSTLTLGGPTTVPAPGGTVALLATANVFTAMQTISVPISGSVKGLILINNNDGGGNLLEAQNSLGVAQIAIRKNPTGADYFLGIGTGTPGAPLHFVTPGGKNMKISGSGFANGANWISDTTTYFGTTSGSVSIYANNAEKIFVKGTTGTVNINSASADLGAQLGVIGNTTNIGLLISNTPTTNVVREVQRLEARVSTASTGGANGFGVGQSFYAETATDLTYQQQGLVATYWVDATNATRKATLALSAYDTAERKGIEIRANGSTPDIALLGDTWWEGEGFGLPYGSCSSNDTDINWTQAAAVQNTWYDISDADMVDGQLNLVTHDGSGKLTVTKGGRYLINYSLVAESSAANNHLETAISVSGTESGQGISHAEAVTPNAERNFSGTAILDLAANATINLSIRTTDAGTPNLKVEMMDITLIMVGGT